jgi:hypothetical protein
MKLSKTDQIVKYAQEIVRLKTMGQSIVELTQETTLAESRGLERLFIPFEDINPTLDFPGKRGFCYRDAYRLAVGHPEFVYCEGLAAPKIRNSFIPLLHAWCMDLRTNEVIDPTWRGKRNCGVAYCGIPFNMKFVNAFLLKSETYGVLEELWMHKTLHSTKLSDIVHPKFLHIIQ